jgi:archaemetzincin
VKPIQVMGIQTDHVVLDGLTRDLARTFGVSCQLRKDSLDISFAFDRKRSQYYSTAILQKMQPRVELGTRLLAVTSLDLYVPVLTFVFGEAQLEGNCALVSLHRLGEPFYGLPARPDLLHERLVKEAVHELGHTFGLLHCEDWNCVMTSSHSVERVDVKSAEFCQECRRVVEGQKPPLQAAARG